MKNKYAGNLISMKTYIYTLHADEISTKEEGKLINETFNKSSMERLLDFHPFFVQSSEIFSARCSSPVMVFFYIVLERRFMTSELAFWTVFCGRWK